MELTNALKQCKLETAPGLDGISSNMLKIGANETVYWLKVISDQIWEMETIPSDWKNQIIVPIHKHGARSLCENYRGIALLCVASKVFGRAILNKMQNVIEKQLGENQCGFRPNRGCCDQIYAAKILMQRAKEFQKPIHLCFIDLQKAYDTVNRDALWEILSKSFSLPEKIIRILKALHSCTTGAIRADGQLSDEFPISVGVKQGDVLAPMLFNTYLDAVIRVALKNHPDKGIRIEYSHNAPLMHNSRYKLEEAITVQSIAYADDIMITSDNIKDLECLVTSIDDVCIKFGLRINFSKTKYMTILPKNSIPSLNTTLAIRNDINIEQVTQFKYLGSILNSDNTVDAEVESRINKASQVFRSLSRLVWYQRKIKVSTKLKLFKAIIIPTLLYGSETWNVLQCHIQRLQVFTNRCLRIITGTSLWDKLRNTQLRCNSKIERVDVMIQRRRLQWLGHLERMENSRLQKKLMVSKIAEGSRSQGGQKKRWHDLIYTDLKKLNIVDTWKTEARNRNDWRKNIKSLSQKINEEAERNEQSKKDLKKNIFDVHSKSSPFQCQHPGCNKIAVNKAGLTNHIRQVHKAPSLQHCPNCNNVFKKQGLHNHVKKCSRNQSSVHLLSSG